MKKKIIFLISLLSILFSSCCLDITNTYNLSYHPAALAFITLSFLCGLACWVFKMPLVGTVLLLFVFIG